MARAISVKVSRSKIIDSLKNRLVTMAQELEDYKQAKTNYKLNIELWNNAVARIAYDNFPQTKDDLKEVSIRDWGYRSDTHTKVEITIDLENSLLPEKPKEPVNPFGSSGYGRNHVGDYDERVQEIKNAIRILEMSDEEVVNTSTYQSVSRYL